MSYPHYSKRRLSKYQEVFNIYDDLGDGKIKAQFIGPVARALGINPTKEEITRYTIPMTPDQRISFETFVPIFRAMAKKNRPKDRISDAFLAELRSYDTHETGRVPVKVMRKMLQTVGEVLTDEEMDQLLPRSKQDVNYEDFVRMIRE